VQRTLRVTPGAGVAAGASLEDEYLVNAMGCHDCHTPKKMGPQGPELDLSRALSGHPEGSDLPPAPRPQGPWAATAA
jgi:hypothetical protein